MKLSNDLYNLNSKWSYTLKNKQENIIDQAIFHENSIIISGFEGTRIKNKSLDAQRFIRVLDLNGNVNFEAKLGLSNYSCTNMLIKNRKLYFGFLKKSSPDFGDLDSKMVLLELNLDTKKIV